MPTRPKPKTMDIRRWNQALEQTIYGFAGEGTRDAGEGRLLIAVLARALEDLLGGCPFGEQKSATRFFAAGNHKLMCEWLWIDPDHMLVWANRLIEYERVKRDEWYAERYRNDPKTRITVVGEKGPVCVNTRAQVRPEQTGADD